MSEFDRYFSATKSSRFAGGSPSNSDPNSVAQGSVPIGDGNVQPTGFVQDGVVRLTSFASTIRPVSIVTANPTLPDTLYPVGSFVYNTTDSPARLYKNVANVWVAGIGPNDIQADSITAGQIAAGAISASEIAVNAVTTGKLDSSGVALQNVGATVVIDATGITILNGALIFKDAYGDTVIDQYGFGRSWQAFMYYGFYNANFEQASTSDIAVSETGSGTPTVNYKASLSPNLAYWVVAASGGILKQVTDTAFPAGVALQSGVTATTGTDRIYQDLPVFPGKTRPLAVTYSIGWTSGTVTTNFYYSYRKSDHSIIGSRTLMNTFPHSAASAASTVNLIPGAAAGLTAAYVRFEVEVVHSPSGTNSVNIGALWSADDTAPQYKSVGVDAIAASVWSSTGVVTVSSILNTNAGINASSYLNMGSGTVVRWTDYSTASSYILTPATVTLTTANTWYKHTGFNAALTVTPGWVGQRFLFTWSGSFALDNVASASVAVRIDSDTSGTLVKWLAIQQVDVPTINKQKNFGGAAIFEPGTASAFWAYFYFQCSAASTVLTCYSGASYATKLEVTAII